MKPRKPHKRSLRATILKLLGSCPDRLSVYDLSFLAAREYPHVDSSVAAMRSMLTNLKKKDMIKSVGKRKCHECHTSQTIYKLSI